MEQPTHVTDVDSTSGATKGFFDLPRELRDIIYDSLLTNERYILRRHKCDMRLRLRNYLYKPLTLINRQFRAELLDRFPKTASCLIVENHRVPLGGQQLPLQFKTSHVEMHLGISCGFAHSVKLHRLIHHTDAFRDGNRILRKLRRISTLTSISISVYLNPHTCTTSCVQPVVDHCALLMRGINPALLSSLEIYHCDFGDNSSNREWDFSGQKTLLYSDATRGLSNVMEDVLQDTVELRSGGGDLIRSKISLLNYAPGSELRSEK